MIPRSPIFRVQIKSARRSILVLAATFITLLALRATRADSQPGPKEPVQRQRGLGFRCVAFSPDGRLVAAGTGEPNELGELILLEASTGKRLFVHNEATGIPSVTFSPDGMMLAIALYDRTAKLLDAATGQERLALRGHTKEVRAVAFAPDGKTLVTGSWDRSIKLWEVATGTEKRTLEGYKDRVFAVAFSPDGHALVATGFAPEAVEWDVNTGQVIRTFSHGGFVVRAATFTPDGRSLLTGGYEGTVRVWDARTGEMRYKFQNLGGVDALANAPAARTLAISGIGKSIQLFEVSLRSRPRRIDNGSGRCWTGSTMMPMQRARKRARNFCRSGSSPSRNCAARRRNPNPPKSASAPAGSVQRCFLDRSLTSTLGSAAGVVVEPDGRIIVANLQRFIHRSVFVHDPS